MNLSLIQRIILGFSLVVACVIAIGGISYYSQVQLSKQVELTASTLTGMLDESNGLSLQLQDANRNTLVHANTKDEARRNELRNGFVAAKERFYSSIERFARSTAQYSEVTRLTDDLKTSALALFNIAENHLNIQDQRVAARVKSAEKLKEFDDEWVFFESDFTDFMTDANSEDKQQAAWNIEFMITQGRGADSYLRKLIAVEEAADAEILVKELELYFQRFEEKAKLIIAEVPHMKDDINYYVELLNNVVNAPDNLVRLHMDYIRLNTESNRELKTLSVDMDNVLTLSTNLITQIRSLSDSALKKAQSEATTYEMIAMILVISAGIASVVIAATIVVSIREPLKQIMSGIDRMASGDLTHHIDNKSKSELGQIALSVNDLGDNLRKLISEILQSAAKLREAVDVSNTMTDRTNADVSKQQEQTNSIATAITEMEHAIQEVSSRSNEANIKVEDVMQSAQTNMNSMQENMKFVSDLKSSMDEANQVMNGLSTETKQISDILSVIQEISEQTNLLALNAAIEAARAGEHGRGFAVVADEVRSLANRTKDATNEIDSMIITLQDMSKKAVSISEENLTHVDQTEQQFTETHDSLTAMMENLNMVTDMSRSIATACEEQSIVAGDVAANVVGISDMSDSIAKDSQELTQNSEMLSKLSADQVDLVSEFKV